MRARLVALAVVLVIAVVQLSRGSGRALAPAPPVPVIAPSPSATRPPASTFARPTRDPFRFADEEPAAGPEGRAPSVRAAAVRPLALAPPPARVRLVGLVRRAGILRAALVVDGEVVLASAGDTVSGFRVLSLDEEGGVRVKDPEGTEATLPLPEEP